MDGSKKIAGIIFAGIIMLALTACKVQPPGYVNLYVDNLISVNDTADPGITPLNEVDTVINHVVDTTTFIQAELPVWIAEEVALTAHDTTYQQEVKELLKAIADSIQLMRRQVVGLNNQHVFLPDTIAVLHSQTTVLKKAADLKADTVYITKEIKQTNGDSIHTDFETNQLLQSKNDTIDSLRKRVHELLSKGSVKTDTFYVFKETARLPLEETRQTDHLTMQLLQAKDEQIQMQQNQLNAMQAAAARTPQQTQVTMEPLPAQPLVRQQADQATQQLLLAKDEQIQMLQNQLNAMQAAAARTPQQTQITMEPIQVQPLVSQQTDQATQQLIRDQNDTILFLQNQLNNLRLHASEDDTVIVVNEVKEIQSPEEIVIEQKTSDLQTLQDTIRLLKTRLLSLEEEISQGVDTSAHVLKDEKDLLYTEVTDTILLVAFYERGEIKPIEEDSLFTQIKKLCSDRNLTKIALSGYTDSSGSEVVNKEITNRRLTYFSEKIYPWVEKEKVFFQNFGDTFASDMVVSDQRRIEIRIYTK